MIRVLYLQIRLKMSSKCFETCAMRPCCTFRWTVLYLHYYNYTGDDSLIEGRIQTA